MRNYNAGKRGRPSVAENVYERPGDFECLMRINGGFCEQSKQSKRTYTNRIYCEIGLKIIKNACDKYPELKQLLPPTEIIGNVVIDKPPKSGILEQLGRMKQQNNFNDSEVLTVASAAAEALTRGVSSKTIQAEIRKIRAAGSID